MPDGKTLVCAVASAKGSGYKLGVRLIDVESGGTVYEKADFWVPDYYSNFQTILSYGALEKYHAVVMHMMATPDGKYLLLVSGKSVLAFDMTTRKPIELGGRLRRLSETSMAFLDSDKFFFAGDQKSAGIYSAYICKFPSGELIKETVIGDQAIWGVSKGANLVLRPLQEYAAGIFDPMSEKVLSASRLSTLDAWDNVLALENGMGGVTITRVDDNSHAQAVAIPLGPMAIQKAGTISRDGKYMAVSMKNRAGVWSLETGKLVKMLRPFRSAYFDQNDSLVGLFTKYMKKDGAVMRVDMDPFATKHLGDLEKEDDDPYAQYADLLMQFKPIGGGILTREYATLHVKRIGQTEDLWSRDFKYEVPACWPANDHRLVLAWDLHSTTAQDEIKKYPKLKQEQANLKKKGLLLELVNPETGEQVDQVVIPEVDQSHGWFDTRVAIVLGDYVLAEGEHGNTDVFRVSDATKIADFFGVPVATDAAENLVVAVNREEEIVFLDMRTGKELHRYNLGSPVRMASIVGRQEKTLMVLTADQVVHRIAVRDQLVAAQK